MPSVQATAATHQERFKRAVNQLAHALAEDRPFRCTIPPDGLLFVERPLPHLLFHRRSPHVVDTASDRLVTPLPPYLIAGRGHDPAVLGPALRRMAELFAESNEQLFVIEVVEDPPDPEGRALSPVQVAAPHFRVVAESNGAFRDVVAELVTRLEAIELCGHPSHVELHDAERSELSREAQAVLESPVLADRCLWVRLEIAPVYRDPFFLLCYPAVLAALQSELDEALLHAIHRFTTSRTPLKPAHPHELGRTTLERAAKEVDANLIEVRRRISFLIQIAPANASSAWRAFRASGFEREPSFEYRPLMLDPLELKRGLYAAPFDAVEDPVVGRLLRGLVEEYDGLLDLLELRDTPAFLPCSLRVFGAPDRGLVRLAEAILVHHSYVTPPPSEDVDALELARQVRARLEFYRAQDPKFPVAVELRDDVAAGIMVERGHVLIHEELTVSAIRAEALVAHEVDTHVVTHHNGLAQPLRVFGLGLAGYETTQEGLAVLAEYLVGGLSRNRLRVLAARVLAVHSLVEGASFVDTFRLLHDHHAFAARQAFDICMRVYRGGGLTKDALYLKGFGQVIRHLRQHGELEPLYAGKLSLEQWRELTKLERRGLLRPPGVTPSWLARADVQVRLEELRAGRSILDLVSGGDAPPDSKRELR